MTITPWKKRTLPFLLTFSLAMIVSIAGGFLMITMPGRSYAGPLPPLTAEETELRDRMREHVRVLAEDIGERNMLRYQQLQQAGTYISGQLGGYGYAVREIAYQVNEKPVANLEAELKGSANPGEVVVVGAHYDTVLGTAGADDNASGVAAMLELARLFQGKQPKRTIRFVAFVNEEPPYFQTEQMGSLVYAREAKRKGENIVGMYSLETIGCYSDLVGSQRYPAPLNLFFPDTGNFIGFVGNFGSGDLVRRAIGAFRETTQFPSEGVAAPELLTGIGWSDHAAFWQAGYPGIMITDTAPFRYQHYHEPGDTPDKLDFERMARVTAGMARVVEREAER